MVVFVAFEASFSWSFDGDHSPNHHTISKEDGGSSKIARGAQNLVKIVREQSNSALGSSLDN